MEVGGGGAEQEEEEGVWFPGQRAKEIKEDVGIPVKEVLMGMFEVVTGCGWWLRLAGTVSGEGVHFLARVPFEGKRPSSLRGPTREDVSRLVDIGDTGVQGLKTPSPRWISSVCTFTGTVYSIVLRLRRVRCVSVYMCVCVCVLLLLLLLSSRRLEAKLFFLGVDALADPVHSLLRWR